MRRILPARLLVVLFFGVSCAAQDLPAPRVVDLKAADGTTLKATFFAAAKPGPGVLLLHQCNQQRKNWDELAGRLAGTGINVLTLDYRGYGESGGTSYKDLPQDEFARMVAEKWPGDVDTAFKYLVAQPGVTRGIVGAGGASCGVNQSIQLARRHPEVKSLVLLSGNTDRDGRAFLRKSEKLPMMLSAADDDGAAVEVMQWLYELSENAGSKFVSLHLRRPWNGNVRGTQRAAGNDCGMVRANPGENTGERSGSQRGGGKEAGAGNSGGNRLAGGRECRCKEVGRGAPA
jgi:dienelactone hydrolase